MLRVHSKLDAQIHAVRPRAGIHPLEPALWRQLRPEDIASVRASCEASIRRYYEGGGFSEKDRTFYPSAV